MACELLQARRVACGCLQRLCFGEAGLQRREFLRGDTGLQARQRQPSRLHRGGGFRCRGPGISRCRFRFRGTGRALLEDGAHQQHVEHGGDGGVSHMLELGLLGEAGGHDLAQAHATFATRGHELVQLVPLHHAGGQRAAGNAQGLPGQLLAGGTQGGLHLSEERLGARVAGPGVGVDALEVLRAVDEEHGGAASPPGCPSRRSTGA